MRTLELIKAQMQQQIEHLQWHGDALHHWHVGVTALDGSEGGLTESVTLIYGVPVYRLLEMGRNDIRAVPAGQSSCHWPELRDKAAGQEGRE